MSCRNSIIKALQEHQNQQSSERRKLYEHQKKCYDAPNKYLGLIIDGMDQNKTLLPHFFRTPKKFIGREFYSVSLGWLYGFQWEDVPRVYFTAPNIHNDANPTITIIHHVLSHWSEIIPEVLYLQLDNTSRENKNQIVFGYLNMLVELGNFQKVKFGFLLVWHTHDHIDQMFSRFFSIPEPVFHVLKKLLTCEGLFWDHMVRRNALNNLMTLASSINFISKKLMGKHLYGARSIQLLQNGGRHQV
jgi:hypothetical protein